MLQCWDASPSKRPSFSELVDVFDKLVSIAHVSAQSQPSHHAAATMTWFLFVPRVTCLYPSLLLKLLTAAT